MHVEVAGIEAPRRRRRPRALIVADALPEEVDWTPWFLTDEEDMAHAPDHNDTSDELHGALQELAREREMTGERLGRDEFFAWVRDQPLVRVSPDVFIAPETTLSPMPRMWQTWLAGQPPPRFAVEIVSELWKKDYEDNPPKYWQLGCRELVIFDPAAARGEAQEQVRVALQVYRRDAEGAFVLAYAGTGPAESKELGAWLVVRHGKDASRLRIARDAAGLDLVPTVNEAREAAGRAREAADRAREAADRAREEADRAREEAYRAREEADHAREEADHARVAAEEREAKERSARDAAERDLAALREELARLRRGS